MRRSLCTHLVRIRCDVLIGSWYAFSVCKLPCLRSVMNYHRHHHHHHICPAKPRLGHDINSTRTDNVKSISAVWCILLAPKSNPGYARENREGTICTLTELDSCERTIIDSFGFAFLFIRSVIKPGLAFKVFVIPKMSLIFYCPNRFIVVFQFVTNFA